MSIVSRTYKARAAMTLAIVAGAMNAIGGSVVAQLDNSQKPAAALFSAAAVAIGDEENSEVTEPTIQDSERWRG